MVTTAKRHALMLRAEIEVGSETFVTRTTHVSPSEVVVVVLSDMDPGTQVRVRLSFPTLVAPFSITGEVTELSASDNPNEACTATIKFDENSQLEERLAEVLDRASRPEFPASRMRSIPPRGEYRVLIVEDNPLIREMFAYGISKYFSDGSGIVVDMEGEPYLAWQRIKETRYDLVIVDYYLPGSTGAHLIERVRSEPKNHTLPVVAISVGGAEARTASIAAGADLFLDKPIVLRDLFATLERLTRPREGDAVGLKRVLVVDDSPLILDLTRAALEAAGFEVVTAETLTELETADKGHPPDLIVLDVQMPEAFGDELGETLRFGRGWQSPILLFSNLGDDELAERCARAQLDGFVAKRHGVGRLVQAVRERLVPEVCV